MTRIFVIDPDNGKLLTAQEWKDKAGDRVTDAQLVAIVPWDGSPAFVIYKRHLGELDWEKATETVSRFSPEAGVLPAGIADSWMMPTRKQAVDIFDARTAGLDDLLEMIGGDRFPGEWFWTSEKYLSPGSLKYVEVEGNPAWSSSRCVAGYAWLFSGYYGNANGDYGFYNTYQVVASALLNLRKAQV